MPLDGRLLARARDRLDEIKSENEKELERRRSLAYARIPEMRELERTLRLLMLEVVGNAIGSGSGRDMEQIELESLELQARRAELLVENGWAMDYIDEIYSCRACHDTGFTGGRVCKCLKALYDAERTAELSRMLKMDKQSFEMFRLELYPARKDPHAGVSPRDRMEVVFDACRNYAHNFGSGSMNLLFQGAPGLGKTFLSACIAKVVSKRGFSVVYDTAVSALEAFETQKFARESDSGDDAAVKVRQMLECDLMILDDLGTEMATSFSASALYTLINTRLMNEKKMIISTNLSMDELRRRYSGQIMSRLEGEYQTLTFVGDDIRAAGG